MSTIKEINYLAYKIGFLEGKERSDYYRIGVYKQIKLLQVLNFRWEEKTKAYLSRFKKNHELSKQIKKGLLEERAKWKQRGLMSYSEKIVKSSTNDKS
jgi:ABC-type Na+ transport system ATPase subunit NatA